MSSNQEPEELGFAVPAAARTSRGVVAVVLVLIVGGAFAIGYVKHAKAHDEVMAPRAESVSKVDVISAKSLQSDQALVLPGVARAFEEAKLYPRTSGYVKRWLVDIGDKVTAGQLLAEIEAPDVDAQLAQARAQLAQSRAALVQAQAQREYSKSNAERNVVMANQQLIAKGTLEQVQSQAKVDEATVAADQANIAAMEANVRRLTEMTGFQKVVAPFAGVVIARTIDRGNLVGDSTTAAVSVPMYTIVATDPIRVYVDAPQTVASSIKVGGDAAVTVREFPGRTFPGKVTRMAGALDPSLHVMTTELLVPNTDGTLLPGMYVQGMLSLPVPHRVLEIPATALYNDAQGLRVATVDTQGKIHYTKITIERDTGATLWIATGLTGDEKIVKIAVPSLAEGDSVEVNAAPAPAPAAGSAAGSAK